MHGAKRMDSCIRRNDSMSGFCRKGRFEIAAVAMLPRNDRGMSKLLPDDDNIGIFYKAFLFFKNYEAIIDTNC